MQANQGLSEQEVTARRQRGEGNRSASDASRSYWNILSANLFNFFNILLFAVGLVLILFGRYNDAVITVITAISSTLIRTFQEVRAKHQLDQIALLVRPATTVVRAGVEQTIDAALLVKDDLIHLRDPVRKQQGNPILSGTFCVAGDLFYQMDRLLALDDQSKAFLSTT